jgi:hypothetical protein
MRDAGSGIALDLHDVRVDPSDRGGVGESEHMRRSRCAVSVTSAETFGIRVRSGTEGGDSLFLMT